MYLKTLSVVTTAFLSLLFLVMSYFMPAATMMTANATMDDPEIKCLAQAVYFEARGEPFRGQIAVAQVVHNRTAKRAKSYCDIVFEGSARLHRCQFSFACDGKPEHAREARAWTQAINVANLVKDGKLRDLSGRATHYHANYVSPGWSKKLVRTATIGNHTFYR
jgi:spore germination cell wall hydrolase CwlJ-like protein